MKKFLLALMALAGSVGMADPKAVHGMLVVGTDKIYLSHLPMFHNPHDYQVIFEVELPAEAKAKFVQHQKDNPKVPYYTIVPQAFVLPEMVQNPKPFKASIFSGHFERPGHELILKNIVVSAKKVFFKKLDPKGKDDKTKYLVFGDGNEKFVAHLIGGQPSFDHILQVKTEAKPGAVVALPSADVEVVKDIYLEIDELR